MKKKQLAAEVTMMLAAQQMVDRWLHSPGRGPFKRAVEKEQRERWSDFPEMEPYRHAFRRVANAIRLGEGHAVANPGPLLEIARRSLRSIPHPR